MQWTVSAEKRLLIYATLAAIVAATWHFIDLNFTPRSLGGTPGMELGPTVYTDAIALESTLICAGLWSAMPILNAFIGLLLKSTARMRPFTMVALLHAAFYTLYAVRGASHDMYLYIALVPIIGAVLFVGIHFSALIMPAIRRAINAPFRRENS